MGDPGVAIMPPANPKLLTVPSSLFTYYILLFTYYFQPYLPLH